MLGLGLELVLGVTLELVLLLLIIFKFERLARAACFALPWLVSLLLFLKVGEGEVVTRKCAALAHVGEVVRQVARSDQVRILVR